MLMSNEIYKLVKKCFVNVHSINRIQVMCDTHKFKSVTKSFTWHTKYANAHNVIPIIRSQLYCAVSAAKPLMQPKTLVRKYQTILRFILDLLKLGKSLEKKSRVYPSYFICHTKSIIYTKVHRIYSSALNIEYFLYRVCGKIFSKCWIVPLLHNDILTPLFYWTHRAIIEFTMTSMLNMIQQRSLCLMKLDNRFSLGCWNGSKIFYVCWHKNL